MRQPIDDQALDIAFREARTYPGYRDTPIDEATLRRLYDLLKWGPTSMNCQPSRYVFVTSPQAKQRLMPALSEGNRIKVDQAATTVIVATDTRFYEYLPTLAPHAPKARDNFANNPEKARITAFRNGTLQGGYLIIAARMLGLDAGPMSGFDNAAVDAEFFPDGRLQSNFLVNLGVGDAEKLRPRAPRLSFEEAAEIL